MAITSEPAAQPSAENQEGAPQEIQPAGEVKQTNLDPDNGISANRRGSADSFRALMSKMDQDDDPQDPAPPQPQPEPLETAPDTSGEPQAPPPPTNHAPAGPEQQVPVPETQPAHQVPPQQVAAPHSTGAPATEIPPPLPPAPETASETGMYVDPIVAEQESLREALLRALDAQGDAGLNASPNSTVAVQAQPAGAYQGDTMPVAPPGYVDPALAAAQNAAVQQAAQHQHPQLSSPASWQEAAAQVAQPLAPTPQFQQPAPAVAPPAHPVPVDQQVQQPVPPVAQPQAQPQQVPAPPIEPPGAAGILAQQPLPPSPQAAQSYPAEPQVAQPMPPAPPAAQPVPQAIQPQAQPPQPPAMAGEQLLPADAQVPPLPDMPSAVQPPTVEPLAQPVQAPALPAEQPAPIEAHAPPVAPPVQPVPPAAFTAPVEPQAPPVARPVPPVPPVELTAPVDMQSAPVDQPLPPPQPVQQIQSPEPRVDQVQPAPQPLPPAPTPQLSDAPVEPAATAELGLQTPQPQAQTPAPPAPVSAKRLELDVGALLNQPGIDDAPLIQQPRQVYNGPRAFDPDSGLWDPANYENIDLSPKFGRRTLTDEVPQLISDEFSELPQNEMIAEQPTEPTTYTAAPVATETQPQAPAVPEPPVEQLGADGIDASVPVVPQTVTPSHPMQVEDVTGDESVASHAPQFEPPLADFAPPQDTQPFAPQQVGIDFAADGLPAQTAAGQDASVDAGQTESPAIAALEAAAPPEQQAVPPALEVTHDGLPAAPTDALTAPPVVQTDDATPPQPVIGPETAEAQGLDEPPTIATVEVAVPAEHIAAPETPAGSGEGISQSDMAPSQLPQTMPAGDEQTESVEAPSQSAAIEPSHTIDEFAPTLDQSFDSAWDDTEVGEITAEQLLALVCSAPPDPADQYSLQTLPDAADQFSSDKKVDAAPRDVSEFEAAPVEQAHEQRPADLPEQAEPVAPETPVQEALVRESAESDTALTEAEPQPVPTPVTDAASPKFTSDEQVSEQQEAGQTTSPEPGPQDLTTLETQFAAGEVVSHPGPEAVSEPAAVTDDEAPTIQDATGALDEPELRLDTEVPPAPIEPGPQDLPTLETQFAAGEVASQSGPEDQLAPGAGAVDATDTTQDATGALGEPELRLDTVEPPQVGSDVVIEPQAASAPAVATTQANELVNALEALAGSPIAQTLDDVDLDQTQSARTELDAPQVEAGGDVFDADSDIALQAASSPAEAAEPELPASNVGSESSADVDGTCAGTAGAPPAEETDSEPAAEMATEPVGARETFEEADVSSQAAEPTEEPTAAPCSADLPEVPPAAPVTEAAVPSEMPAASELTAATPEQDAETADLPAPDDSPSSDAAIFDAAETVQAETQPALPNGPLPDIAELIVTQPVIETVAADVAPIVASSPDTGTDAVETDDEPAIDDAGHEPASQVVETPELPPDGEDEAGEQLGSPPALDTQVAQPEAGSVVGDTSDEAAVQSEDHAFDPTGLGAHDSISALDPNADRTDGRPDPQDASAAVEGSATDETGLDTVAPPASDIAAGQPSPVPDQSPVQEIVTVETIGTVAETADLSVLAAPKIDDGGTAFDDFSVAPATDAQVSPPADTTELLTEPGVVSEPAVQTAEPTAEVAESPAISQAEPETSAIEAGVDTAVSSQAVDQIRDAVAGALGPTEEQPAIDASPVPEGAQQDADLSDDDEKVSQPTGVEQTAEAPGVAEPKVDDSAIEVEPAAPHTIEAAEQGVSEAEQGQQPVASPAQVDDEKTTDASSESVAAPTYDGPLVADAEPTSSVDSAETSAESVREPMPQEVDAASQVEAETDIASDHAATGHESSIAAQPVEPDSETELPVADQASQTVDHAPTEPAAQETEAAAPAEANPGDGDLVADGAVPAPADEQPFPADDLAEATLDSEAQASAESAAPETEDAVDETDGTPAWPTEDAFDEVDEFDPDKIDPKAGETARMLLDIMSKPSGAAQPQERSLAADTLLRLVPKVPVTNLVALAERICLMESPPPLLVNKLLKHPRHEVAGPLLEGCSGISDQVLMAVIASDDFDKQRMIARRRALTPTMCDALLDHGDESVYLTIVRNPGASISHDAFMRLSLNARDHPALQAPLVTRGDTPAPVAFELFWFLPSELRRYVLSRFLTDSETLDKILKITMAVDGGANPGDEGGETKFADKAKMQQLVDIVADGETDSAADLLSELAGINKTNALRIICDEEGEPITVAMKAIGYPRNDYSAVVDRWRESTARLSESQRATTELQGLFDSLSFNKARMLLTYWDWATNKTGPYARKAA